jgi:hypothetical protein
MSSINGYMPMAKQVINKYMEKNTIKKMTNDDITDFKMYLIEKYGKDMPKNLYIVNGSGGGQKYKILYDVKRVDGNAGKPCVFYTEMREVAQTLEREGHLALEDWIKNIQ